jgi:hypothetical protein
MLNKNKSLDIEVPKMLVEAFTFLAKQKIKHEGWSGRNTDRKAKNFVMCWISEYAWKEILGSEAIKYIHEGIYVGPVENSPKSDFIVWENNNKKSIGIRSRSYDQLSRYQEVSYPDDRLKVEKEIISDYIVICSIKNNISGGVLVQFFGAIKRKDFLEKYENTEKKFSPINQENFRLLPLKEFSYELMNEKISAFDRRIN